MTETTSHPADVFMHLVVTSLAPIFLAATGGNLDDARAAAIATINAYNPRNQADLLPIAQILAFGLAALGSISLSMAGNIPFPLILRLRGNATSLNRAAEQCRRALRETPAPDAAARAAPTAPSAAPCCPPEFSEAERRIEEAVIAEVARTQQRLVDYQASFDAAERQPTQAAAPATAAMAAPVLQDPAMEAIVAQRRNDEAETVLKAPARRPTTTPAAQHVSMTGDEARRAAWSSAMADVAGEVAAEIATLPPSERRAAGIRAAALASAANHLLTGGSTSSPC
jgi:hypothetical protein